MEDEGIVNKLIIKILRLFLVEIPNSSCEALDIAEFGQVITFAVIDARIDYIICEYKEEDIIE